MSSLAIHGGPPVRNKPLPYGRQCIGQDDINAVLEVLRSDWLTTGPRIAEFEKAFADYVDTKQAVAVSSGTAALHAAMYAIDIRPGDEVIVPVMTFAASANCVVYQGGLPVFVDVEPSTLTLDPFQLEAKISPRTKAVIAVDYAGQPCDYDTLRSITDKYKLWLVADSCHSLGGRYKGQAVGSLADLSVFSLHPVKAVTTGEGGVITTDRSDLADRMRIFRNHGITTTHRQREDKGSWLYEMVDLGYNYRITDLQCALGLSQLLKLSDWIKRRHQIAGIYDSALDRCPYVKPLTIKPSISHAYHLYVVRLQKNWSRVSRNEVFAALRAEGIGVNVHYIPLHFHPYYQAHHRRNASHYPVAESAYENILSLPIFVGMSDSDVEDVIEALHKVLDFFSHH